MSSKLSGFKRRAAGYVEKGEAHRGESLSLLFAPGASFTDGSFDQTTLNLAALTNVTFRDMSFRGCDLIGANLRGASLECVTFERCNLTGASFEGARLRATGFQDCILEGASFLGATLMAPVSFIDSSLVAADLRFYESDAGQPYFVRVNLRQATFAVNCEFWNGTFDDEATADFGRVWARASRNAELIEYVKKRWGAEGYDMTDKYMRRT